MTLKGVNVMQTQTKKLTLYALFVALTMVVTMTLKIPSFVTGGYLNMGDSMVMLAGWLLGPIGGFWAGGLGSALADLALGYTVYAPITFVVKGIEGVLAALIFRALSKTSLPLLVSLVITGFIAGCWMAVGYCAVEVFMYGAGKAIAELPHNIGQGTAGMVAATVLYTILSPLSKRYLS